MTRSIQGIFKIYSRLTGHPKMQTPGNERYQKTPELAPRICPEIPSGTRKFSRTRTRTRERL